MPHNVACDRCNSLFVDDAGDGNLTCFSCGKVLEETGNLVNNVDIQTTNGVTRACGSIVDLANNGFTAATSVPRNGSLHRRLSDPSSVKRHLEIICAKVNAPPVFLEQMLLLRANLVDMKYTRWPDVFAAALAYIIFRNAEEPYTLKDISFFIQKPSNLVGRVYDLIVRENVNVHVRMVQPSVYLEKVCAQYKSIPLTHVNKLRALSLRLLDVIQEQWILTGKRLDITCGATIQVASEVIGCTGDFRELCNNIKAGEPTVRTRVKEVKELLLQTSILKLPWMKEVKLKDLHKHLEHALTQLETIKRIEDRNRPPPPPPSPPTIPLALPAPPSSPARPQESPTEPQLALILIGSPITDSAPPFTESFPNAEYADPPPQIKAKSPYPNPYAQPQPIIYQDVKEDHTLSKPQPRAFIRQQKKREKRGRMLFDAQHRIKHTVEECPAVEDSFCSSVRATLAALPPSHSPPASSSPSSSSHSSSPASSPSPSSSTETIYPPAPAYRRFNTPPSTPPTPYTPPTPPTPSTPPASTPSTPLRTHSAPTVSRRTFADLGQIPPTKPKPLSTRRRAVKLETKKESKAGVPLLQVTHEDLIVETLFARGVSTQRILDGYYHDESCPETKADIHSEQLGEGDIPDSEMSSFIRSEEEVECLKRVDEINSNLMSEGTPTKKKKKPTGNKRRKVNKKKPETEEEAEEASKQENDNEVQDEGDGEEEQLTRKRSRASTV